MSDSDLANFLAKTSTIYLDDIEGKQLVEGVGGSLNNWTLKGLWQDSRPYPLKAYLYAVNGNIAVNVTPVVTSVAQAPIEFTTTFSDVVSWNLAANSTTPVPFYFTADSRQLNFQVFPGRLARTKDIFTSLVTSLNAMGIMRLS